MTEEEAKQWTGVWAFKAVLEFVGDMPDPVPKDALLDWLRSRLNVAEAALLNASIERAIRDSERKVFGRAHGDKPE